MDRKTDKWTDADGQTVTDSDRQTDTETLDTVHIAALLTT